MVTTIPFPCGYPAPLTLEGGKEGSQAYYSSAIEEEREPLISLLILAPSSVTAAACTAAGEGRADGKRDRNGRKRGRKGSKGGREAVFGGQMEDEQAWKGRERGRRGHCVRSFTCSLALALFFSRAAAGVLVGRGLRSFAFLPPPSALPPPHRTND